MIQKLRIYFTALVAVFIFITAGCKTAQTQVETRTNTVEKPQDYTLEKSLLWKITGNGIEIPSYLFGTIHIIDTDDFFYPEGALAAIDKSKNIFFEIDMKEMTDISAQMGLLDKIFMKDGQTLKNLLSEEEYATVENHFKEMGLPIFMLERMKPMFLTVFASGDMDMNSFNDGSMKSYEMEIMDIASGSEKPTGGLETIDFQISIFDSIPYDVQAQMLVETIKTADGDTDQFAEMVNLYKTQNIDAMVTMISDEDSGLEGFETLLVDKRNMNWIPIMSELMKEDPTFFAVGAGHLAGQNGVIWLLRKAGYTVTPVKSATDI